MVGLTASSVTRGALVSQWPEAITMARGRPMRVPKAFRNSRAGTSSSGKVGAPWERNRDGRAMNQDRRAPPLFQADSAHHYACRWCWVEWRWEAARRSPGCAAGRAAAQWDYG